MSGYEELNDYPHLKRFCEEEHITLQPFKYTSSRLNLHNMIQTTIPPQRQNRISESRALVDCCLRFGYEHSLINQDRRQRLKADDQNFWSIFGELRIGNWLENMGLSFKEFEPPAIGNKKGDYLINTQQGLDIFIEVKVLSGDRDFCAQSELLGMVADLARQIRPEINDITGEEYHYINRSDTAVLLEKIRLFLMGTSLPATFSEPNTTNPNIQIVFNSISGAPFSVGWGGSVGIDDKLRDLLHVPINAADYGIQLSQNPLPSVALIYDMGSWASEAIESVLYGTRVINTITGIDYRNNDGIWDVNMPSPLSAVGILKFSIESPLPSFAGIYLAPKAEYPVAVSDFLPPSIKFMNISPNGFDVDAI